MYACVCTYENLQEPEAENEGWQLSGFCVLLTNLKSHSISNLDIYVSR